MLDFERVSKIFRGPDGQVEALSEVTLAVASGELVAVRGPSGCGKSTLLFVAGAMLTPCSGRVLVDGEDPYVMPPAQRSNLRAQRIGFVFQQFHLVPYLSVLENVLAPSVPRPREHAQERAAELVRRFNLEHRARHVPAQLSTGERQRTALARALFNEPKLLLADEPTGNLDDENGQIVLDHLRAFAAAGGAVLLVTHDHRVAELADRALAFGQGGRLITQD